MGSCEPLVDGHLVGPLTLGQPALAQVQEVQALLRQVRDRYGLACRRFGQSRHIEQRQAGDTGLGRGNARDGLNLLEQ